MLLPLYQGCLFFYEPETMIEFVGGKMIIFICSSLGRVILKQEGMLYASRTEMAV